MPVVRIYRARADLGRHVSGLLFSYDPIAELDTEVAGHRLRVWQIKRFYIETPKGCELVDVDGEKMVRDADEGENVYMRAARVVSRVWQRDLRYHIISSIDYPCLDQEEQ